MTRTTPPRPVDIAAVFPELAALARTSVRLHPRPGSPSCRESSIGGPLLWPAEEPWPVCEEDHHGEQALTLDQVRARRKILEAAWRRPRPPGQNLLTAEEQAVVEARPHPVGPGPSALLPVAQLFARDVPGLRCRPGTDLLQVLWCPLSHEDGLPAVRLVWRSSAAVGDVLEEPPVPAGVERFGSYVPRPCVVHPETVTEYPAPHELDEDLAKRVHEWNEREYPAAPQDGSAEAGRREVDYQFDLCLAPGWKVGGWGPWSFCDAWPMVCGVCDAPMDPLLTVASDEWDGGNGSWIPVEDRTEPADAPPYPDRSEPTMVSVGRGYNLQIYTCSSSPDHPVLSNMQ